MLARGLLCRRFKSRMLLILALLGSFLILSLIISKKYLFLKRNFVGWGNITYHQRGYWSGGRMAEYHSDHFGANLALRLAQFFRQENAASVVDLGGGSGLYVNTLVENGLLALCYDGNPESQDVSNGVCATMDLTKPMNIGPFDWVLSLSVGRQIPPLLEDAFISNLHNLNTKGLVLFWGDGKTEISKVRPRTVRNSSQIISQFKELGYIVDEPSGTFLRAREPREFDLLVLRKQNSYMPFGPMFSRSLKEVSVGGPEINRINIAVTCCGTERINETLILIKSAIIFSQHTRLRAFVYSDNISNPILSLKLSQLQEDSRHIHPNFKYKLLPVSFPPVPSGMVPWQDVFKPCSLQRLFLPRLHPEIDAIIYFDADAIILSNLTEFWNHFNEMAKSEFIGATAQTEPQTVSWFQKHTAFPHYGEKGLNTGISLMNLTRMRLYNFEDQIYKVRENYEHVRPNETGDQFLQNILYSFHPEFVTVIPCDWNLRRLHCSCAKSNKCACSTALQNGAGVIHGTKNAFTHQHRLSLFKHIYEAFDAYNFSTDRVQNLVKKLSIRFEKEKNTCFFNSSHAFYLRMESYANNLENFHRN